MSRFLYPGESPETFLVEHEAIVSGSGPSFPDPNSAGNHVERNTETTVGATILRFVLWKHVEENVEEITPYLVDCDVIAREMMFPTRRALSEHQIERYIKRRELAATALSFATGVPVSEHERAELKWAGKIPPLAGKTLSQRQAERVLRRSELTGLDKLRGVGARPKRIVDLDAGPEHTNRLIELQKNVGASRDQFIKLHASDTYSWSELHEAFNRYLRSRVDETEFREQLTLSQLGELVRKYPGNTIAVVYGGYHHTLTRQFEAATDAGVAMQRIFPPDRSGLKVDAFSSARLTCDDRALLLMRAGQDYQHAADLAILARMDTDMEYQAAFVAATEEQREALLAELQAVCASGVSPEQGAERKGRVERYERIQSAVRNFVRAVKVSAEHVATA